MASRNPFALLAGEGGDDSDYEQQTLQKQSKPASSAAPAAAAGGSVKPAQRRTVPGQASTRPQKETRELPAAADAPGFEGERGRDDRGTGFQRGGRGGRGRGERGSGRGRGAGGARTARPDRRSATGITDSDKKEHQGWGGDDGKRELEAENAAEGDAAAEKAAAVDGEAAPAADAEGDAANGDKKAEAPAAAPAAPVEEEDNSKSYEEYLAERKAAGRGILENLTGASGRKANEGSDDSQWKDGVLLEKTEGDAYFEGKQKEKNVKQKQRKEKNLLEVEFAAPPRTDSGRGEGGRGRGRGERGTGRGGRGGDRGSGRGRGAPRGGNASAPRGGRGAANGVNVDDSAAFPSLS